MIFDGSTTKPTVKIRSHVFYDHGAGKLFVLVRRKTPSADSTVRMRVGRAIAVSCVLVVYAYFNTYIYILYQNLAVPIGIPIGILLIGTSGYFIV